MGMKQVFKFGLLCLILVAACCGLYDLYRWLNTPVINFAWEDVFIDTTTLPSIEKAGQIHDGYGCIDSPLYSGCESGFTSKHMWYSFEKHTEAYQDVGYYVSKNRASRDYSRVKEFLFYKGSDETEYNTPEGLEYQGQEADQFHFACNTKANSKKSQCKMIGQYGKFIVFLAMYGKPVDVELFEQAIMAVDKKMSYYASKF